MYYAYRQNSRARITKTHAAQGTFLFNPISVAGIRIMFIYDPYCDDGILVG